MFELAEMNLYCVLVPLCIDNSFQCQYERLANERFGILFSSFNPLTRPASTILALAILERKGTCEPPAVGKLCPL